MFIFLQILRLLLLADNLTELIILKHNLEKYDITLKI